MADDIVDPFKTAATNEIVDPFKSASTTTESKPKETSWGEVATGAIENAWPSIKQLGSDIVQPIVHPIDTAKSLGNIGMGAAEKLIPGSEGPHEKYANAVGEHFANRYGGMENLKKTMAADPAGFLADLSTVLSGGSFAAARAPGVAGSVARAAGTAGKILDPIMAPVNAVKAAAEVVPGVLGLSTGVGHEAVKTAYRSGVKGGEAGEAFRENIRGYTAPAEVVEDARNALRTLRKERSDAYVADMAKLGKDPTVLNFGTIDKAITEGNKVKKFGTQELAPSTTKVRTEIAEVINEWKSLDPAQYHTPVGLDALKQRIGDIKDSLPFNTPERLVAEKAYGAIRETIIKQAPDYAKVMRGYENASKQIDEVSRTLSLNPKASVDTTLRKLQSAIRNNVNTNYGNRTQLTKTLSEHGAPELMEKLSGQAMNSVVPRGLAGIAGLGEAYAAVAHLNPLMLAGLPFASPRLVGEAAHIAGRGVGAVKNAIPKSVRDLKLPSGSVRAAAQAARLSSPRIPQITVHPSPEFFHGIQSPSAAGADENQPNIPRPPGQQKDGGAVEQKPGFAHGGRVSPENIDHNPTEAQKEAGNYAKDHVKIHGLDLTVENARGKSRSGVGRDGKRWSVKMPAHYGYLKRTNGADGDHVDCYIGPNIKSQRVYIIDQADADAGHFDEHKCMIGFGDKKQAVETYKRGFSDGRGHERIGHVTEMSIDQFKQWLSDGDTTKPLKRATGGTVPENPETLKAQQQHLISGHRAVQMFPKGTKELPVPRGIKRLVVNGHVFHYDHKRIDVATIRQAVAAGRENDILGLGPYSKADMLRDHQAGGIPLAVVERKHNGTEVRAAAGTHRTAPVQSAHMNATKARGSSVRIENPADTIARRLRAAGGMTDWVSDGDKSPFEVAACRVRNSVIRRSHAN